MDRGVPAGERPQASTASGKCASIPATGTDHGSRMFISRSDLSHRSPMRNDSKRPFAGADCLVGHRPREFLFTAIPPQKQGVHGLPLVRSCRCCSRRTGTGPASAGPQRKRAQAIEDGCGRCVSERLRPAPVAAFAAGPGFAQHAGNRLRREFDARPAGCIHCTDGTGPGRLVRAGLASAVVESLTECLRPSTTRAWHRPPRRRSPPPPPLRAGMSCGPGKASRQESAQPARRCARR